VLSEAAGADPFIDTRDFFRAYHISQWRTESAFCGRCGSPNGDATDELARLCPKCGRREYARISPAVIVLVTRDDGRALLAHNAKFREGLYSLVAGFVEAGESLEHTVAREIREEVGVEVQDIEYRASQAWPFPNSLMLAFRARWASGEPRPDNVEIADVRWFAPDALPEIPAPGSISRALIDEWLRESGR
jgi:NAD+ diphosphatase